MKRYVPIRNCQYIKVHYSKTIKVKLFLLAHNLNSIEKLSNMMVLFLTVKFAVLLMLTLEVSSLPSPEKTTPQIYLHTGMFEDNYHLSVVTPKDVASFKYFCTQDYISSMVNQYIYLIAVSDIHMHLTQN